MPDLVPVDHNPFSVQLMPVDHDPYHSPDMPITLPTLKERLEAFGAPASENIEDRRNEPKSGYESMLAFNNLVGAFARHEFPWLRDLDLGSPDRLPPRRLPQPSQLTRDIGLEDIRHEAATKFIPVDHDPFERQ